MKLTPNFFIVGTPKAGTTALHAYLQQHPQVCMSSEKEPNYFSHKEIASQKLYYDKSNLMNEHEYLSLFNCNDLSIAVGEASVSYLFYPDVAKRIYNFNPNAKIIISLREPVARAFSHFQMDYGLGLVKESFDKIVENGADDASTGIYYQQYVCLGEYYEQVKRYVEVFGRSQVLIFLHENLINNSSETLVEICKFLSIDPSLRFSEFQHQNVTAAGKNKFIRTLYSQKIIRKTLGFFLADTIKLKVQKLFFSKKALPSLSITMRDKLKNHYHSDLLKLQQLIGRDLSPWIAK